MTIDIDDQTFGAAGARERVTMDLGSTITRAIGWRWTPCVAPLLGSIAFVVFCIAVVPDDIGPLNGPSRSSSDRGDSNPAAEPSPDTPLVDPTSTSAAASPRRHRDAPTPRVTSKTSDTIQSFFRTREALPVEPADPDPGEPAAPPPPPPPTATIFTLPEPPPAATPPSVVTPPSELAVPSAEQVPAAPEQAPAAP